MSSQTDESTDELLESLGIVSRYGWKARFDREPEVQCKPFNLPRLSQIMHFLPMSFRYAFRFYLRKRLVERRLPFLDPTRHVPWKPIYGVPMGGIGCGSIGRGYCGEFIRSSLIPGMYSYDPQPADQFILTIRKLGKMLYHQVLSLSPPSSARSLRAWSWGFPAQNARYVGLYPRSWTVYELPQLELALVCQQISPVLPHNYKDTSLPCCVFVWKVLNFGSEALDVSITLSWHGPNPLPRCASSPGTADGFSLNSNDGSPQSGATNPHISSDDQPSENYLCRSAPFSLDKSNIHGCTLHRLIGNELPCCFGVAARSSKKITVSKCPGFLFDQSLSSSSSTKPSQRHYSATSKCSMKNEIESTYFCSYKQASTPKTVWDCLQSSSGLKDINTVGFYVPDTQPLRRQPPKLAVMVSASCTVPAGDKLNPGTENVEFAVVWHSPIVRFRTSSVVYRRRYARWFPESGMKGARRLLEYALLRWPHWVRKIEHWQNPILENSALPEWYKSALFNELYYLTDGGTVWLDPVRVHTATTDHSSLIPIDLVRADKQASHLDPHNLTGRHLTYKLTADATPKEQWKYDSWKARGELGRDMGLFAYLEGHEYRMYNTVDVHFYASWAFIKLWPKLQLALNYDCADLTIEDDRTETYFIHEGCYGVRHVESSVPHDFGDPENEPWRDGNAYIMFPTDQWKDLTPKFILQAWRDWSLTRDYGYLVYMLPIVCRLVRICLKTWDSDGDGMIENSGFPDQTFDTWKTHGISAYTGGLWLACIYAAHDMLRQALSASSPMSCSLAQATDENGIPWAHIQDEFQSILMGAKNAYNRALWTGTYYAYQSSRLGNYDSIMAAQLCGHWFLRTAGAPDDAILPNHHILTTLKTIEAANWHSVQGGIAGAVNGVLPCFKQDLSNVQAEEFWVGVNYSLGSTFIMEGMPDQGLALAGMCYNTVYNRFGLQYQTPEAYLTDGRFRCPGYMRPLAIWSIQQALELKQMHPATSETFSDDSDDECLKNDSTFPTDPYIFSV